MAQASASRPHFMQLTLQVREVMFDDMVCNLTSQIRLLLGGWQLEGAKSDPGRGHTAHHRTLLPLQVATAKCVASGLSCPDAHRCYAQTHTAVYCTVACSHASRVSLEPDALRCNAPMHTVTYCFVLCSHSKLPLQAGFFVHCRTQMHMSTTNMRTLRYTAQ